MKKEQQEKLDPMELRNRIVDLRKARSVVAKSIKDLGRRYRSVLALMKEEAKKLDQDILLSEALLENLSKLRANNLDESEVVNKVQGAGQEFNNFTTKLGELYPDLSLRLADDATRHGFRQAAQDQSDAA